MNEPTRPAQLRKVLDEIERRTRDNGYENAYDFHRRSQVPVAYYTVLRAFDHRERPPAVETMILLAHSAGCSPSEIRQMLISIGDKHWHRLIGEHQNGLLSVRERALVSVVREVTKDAPQNWKRIADAIGLMAEARGLELSDDLDKIR